MERDDHATPEGTPAPVEAIQAFLSARSWAEQRQLVGQYPALASTATDTLMAQWLEDNLDADPVLIGSVIFSRVILARCQVIGVDAAYTEFISQGVGVNNISPQLLVQHVGEAYDSYPELLPAYVAFYEHQLAKLSGEADIANLTMSWWGLGLAYHKSLRGSRTHNLQRSVIYIDRYLASPLTVANPQFQEFPTQILLQALHDLVFVMNMDIPLIDPTGWTGLCDQLLERFPREQDGLSWACLQFAIGIGKAQLSDQDPANLAQAAEHLESALSVFDAGSYPNEHALVNAGLGDISIARLDGNRFENIEAAIQACEASKDLIESFYHPSAWARICTKLGEAYRLRIVENRAGTLEQAIDLFEQAGAVFSSGQLYYLGEDELDLWARLNYDLGIAYMQHPGEDRVMVEERALAHYAAALEIWTRQASPSRWALIQLNLGNAYSLRSTGDWYENYQQALASYQGALEVTSPQFEPELFAEAHEALGEALRHYPMPKNIEKAIEHFEQALSVYTREEMPEKWMETHTSLANAYSNRSLGDREQNTRQAIHHFEMALQADDPAQDRTRNIQSLFGITMFIDKRWERANQAFEAAIHAADFVLARTLSETGQRAEISTAARLYARSAFCLLKMGRYTEALLRLEAGKTRMIALQLSQAEDPLDRIPQALRKEFVGAKLELAEVAIENELFYGTPGRRSAKALSHAYRQASLHLADVVRQVSPERFGLDLPRLDLGTIIEMIPAGGALVIPVITEAGSAVFILPHGIKSIDENHILFLDFTANELRAMLVGAGEHHYGWVRAYFEKPQTITVPGYAEFTGNIPGELWPSVVESTTSQIWDRLISPIHEFLRNSGLEPEASITIIPDGGLAMLPLHAAWRMQGDLENYFLDDYTISYAPSLLALRNSMHHKAQVDLAGATCLAVIDPTEDLPLSHLEIESIESFFPPDKLEQLSRSAASTSAVLERLPNHTCLHFSCHGVYSLDDPLKSALIMAGEERLALAAEWLERHLGKARLVFLSACETAITEFERSPDEYLGFPTLLLQGGAAGVVSTLWAVNVLSTALLVDRFYLRLRDNLSPAQALRQAQLWLRDVTVAELVAYLAEKRRSRGPNYQQISAAWRHFAQMEPSIKPYFHPYYWAAFTFTGV